MDKEDKRLRAATNQSHLILTSRISAAYFSNNSANPEEVDTVIKRINSTLGALANGNHGKPQPKPEPAVSIKQSVTPDYLICLEDGKKLKMLKRYLKARHNMTPDEYRARWNLPASYPMVAPNYAKQRSEFAKKIGLGKADGGKSG
ncbi:MucR family transcriptional regulator [Minwuia sp.]|uniref:MucR family transcriptional regulator n=1 Tax=Minwuia sp. TaxID=2493630 RepID=UPI003A8EE7FB